MSEINRVYTAVEAFFDASGIEKIDELGGIIGKTVRKAMIRLCEKARDYDEDVWNVQRDLIEKAEADVVEAVADAEGRQKEENIEIFQKLAKRAMMLRRSGYPMGNPEASYLPDLTPEEALMSDDSYAFAIFDTLAEEIQFILPALFGLAVEGEPYEDVKPPV